MLTATMEFLLSAATFPPPGSGLPAPMHRLLLYIVTNVLAVAAYLSIPLSILTFVRRRQPLAHRGLFLLFAAFILSCGITHAMAVVTLWYPAGVLQELMTLVTAILSVLAAVTAWRVLPEALALPRPRDLQDKARELEAEIKRRVEVENQLRSAHRQLESRVEARTRELCAANLRLHEEICGRRDLERALRRSAEDFRAIVEDQAELICRFTRDGRITYANPAFCRYFALPEAQGVGRRAFEKLPPVAADSVRALLDSLTPDNPVGEIEHAVATGEGLPRWLRWTHRAFFDHDGRILEYQGVGHDVTNRKRAEEAAIRAKGEAEKANRAKSEFLASVSHDLRTPLNAILGFADFMRSGHSGKLPNARHREYIEYIHESGRHLVALIDDILDLGKIEAGTLGLHFEHISVDRLLESALRDATADAKRRNIVLVPSASDDRPLTLWADAKAARRMVDNILSNAIKFTPPGGRVTLSSYRLGQEIAIAVADTGPGMSPIEMDRILDPYFRSSNAMIACKHGAGLGLAIVKSLIENHDGRIDFASKPDRGTTVTLVFPDSAAQAALADARDDEGTDARTAA